MTRCLLAVVVVLGAGACRSVQEAPRPPAQSAEQPLREELMGIPVGKDPKDGRPMLLQATLYRPRRDGRVPLAIVNHGSPVTMDPDRRRGVGRARFEALSRWLVDRGFAVVVPMRRGFAGSDGEYAEDFGPCQDPDYARTGREAARDVSATLDHLSHSDFVDPHRIIVLGHSTGGWAAIAFSANAGTAVGGFINFAGGRGGRDPNGSGERCARPPLLEATALFGRTSRIPSLWVYAENDNIFPPDVARAMLDSFRGAGGQAELVVLPPIGKEGHPFIHRPDAVPLWSAPVSRFLQGLGYSVQP